MASAFFSEEDLSCPVCCDIFKDPVFLTCSHNICKGCLKTFWEEKISKECPICRRKSSREEPPINLHLRNQCERFIKDGIQKGVLGSLHHSKLVHTEDDKEPVCLVCPVDEAAAQECKKMESQVAEACDAIEKSGASTLEEITAEAESEMEKLNNVTLDIAVTGGSGTGKSSFVNAIRGVKDDDKGAAPTGEVECTKTLIKYPHPSMPNVNIWDLPGIGTENFKAEKYLEIMNFDGYDFFVIVVGKRVTENDILLAKEIRGKEKNCYIIRSMIDHDVEAGKRKGKTEEETITSIRQDLEEKFKPFDGFHTYLVSSWYLDRFDFKDLIKLLENDLSEPKSNALIQSLPVYSMECLDKKYKTFKKLIWAVAFISGAVGSVPVPGVSAAFDIPAIMSFLVKVYYSFGLDEKTLHRLSETDKPIHAQVHESMLIKAIAMRSVALLAVEFTSVVALKGIGASLKLIPIFGSATGAAVSFTTTLFALRKGLDELYRAAKPVNEMAELEK